MTDVFDAVRAANPIKDIDRYAEVVAGLDAQFHDMSRRDRMIDDKPSLVELETTPPPRRRPRRQMVAGLAAVVLVVVIGLGIVMSSSGDDAEPADAAAPTTVVTQPPVTTDAPGTDRVATTAPAPAVLATPLETVETFLERWVAADVEGAETLVSPAATLRCYECLDTAIKPWAAHKYLGVDIRTMAIADASGSGVEYSCSAVDDLVTCSLGYETLFEVRNPTEYGDGFEWVNIFTVADGLITHLDGGFYPDTYSSHSVSMEEYEDWLAAEYPAEYADLFFFGTMLVNDSEQIEAHRQFIAEWVEGG